MRGSIRRRRFADRAEAGRRLARALEPEIDGSQAVILGLPRGGVPVAWEVAQALGAPLDILIVRKLGVPWQRELAFGAIATGGVVIYEPQVLSMIQLSDAERDAVVRREREEMERREQLYREGLPALDVRGRVAVVVDDGIATGSTVRAALKALAERGAAKRVVACPVAPPEVAEALADEADLVVCLERPERFMAVGLWYDDFREVSDDQVRTLLRQARER
jgi:putative phosphoribosyl transferase